MDPAAPRKGSPFFTLLLALLMLALPAAWLGRRAWQFRRIPENEQMAGAALMVVAIVEARIREADPDRNGAQDFWTGDLPGLAQLCSKIRLPAGPPPLGVGSILEVIEDLAAADPAAPTAKPFHGYWFVPLDSDADGKPYRPAGRTTHPAAYGYGAYPASHGVTGRRTFLLNELNTVVAGDTGGAAPRSWPSDAELKRAWSFGGLRPR